MTANAVEIGVPALFTKTPNTGPLPTTTRNTSCAGSYAVSVPRIVPPGVSAGTEPVARDNCAKAVVEAAAVRMPPRTRWREMRDTAANADIRLFTIRTFPRTGFALDEP